MLAAVALLLVAALAAPASARASEFEHNPVVFVHGFFGSGGQFESQKMRLVSNGYPQSHVDVLEYDSLFATESRDDVYARLDALVAELKKRTGKSQVDILGHSLGTTLMHSYLSSPERAADVGHYVNIDGRTADAPPGGVPTLAVWAGRGAPGRQIAGAENVTVENQTHVESATSFQTFEAFYEFFTGEEPATAHIVRKEGMVEIEGRAVLFPQNRGATATGVEVWPIDSATGQRTSSAPLATPLLEADGSWGPIEVEAGSHYEFALVRPGVTTIHFYVEPFVTDDHLVRLLYSEAIEGLIERGEGHVSGIVIRYKEFWGDQGKQNDVISFNGTNACEPTICPIDKRVIGLFAFDRGSDGQTDLSAPHPVFSSLSFLTAADIFMPASRPPTGTTSVALTSRGEGPPRTLNFPNFPSSLDGFSLYFNDFETTIPRCLEEGGRARGRTLGPAKLGRERADQRSRIEALLLGDEGGVDRYCVEGGGELRVGYPSGKAKGARRGKKAGANLISSTSRRFKVAGIRPGSKVKKLKRGLSDPEAVRIAGKRWLVESDSPASPVFRTGAKKVREVGIAAPSLIP